MLSAILYLPRNPNDHRLYKNSSICCFCVFYLCRIKSWKAWIRFVVQMVWIPLWGAVWNRLCVGSSKFYGFFSFYTFSWSKDEMFRMDSIFLTELEHIHYHFSEFFIWFNNWKVIIRQVSHLDKFWILHNQEITKKIFTYFTLLSFFPINTDYSSILILLHIVLFIIV